MLEGSCKQQPEEEPDRARNTKSACSCSSHLAELGTSLFSGCISASKADILQLCSPQSSVAIPCKQKMTGILRASPALGKVAMTQSGWEKDGDSLTGEASALQAVSGLVLSTVPHIPDSPGRQNRELVEEVTFPAAQTSPECQQKNEGRSCIPRCSWDATASLGSAAWHCSFPVTLQGRQQPPSMPPSTLSLHLVQVLKQDLQHSIPMVYFCLLMLTNIY